MLIQENERQLTYPKLSGVFHNMSICNGPRQFDEIDKFTADGEHTHHIRRSLPLPFQMQISKKRNTFCARFIAVLEFTLNFELSLQKKSHSISGIIHFKRRGYLNG